MALRFEWNVDGSDYGYDYDAYGYGITGFETMAAVISPSAGTGIIFTGEGQGQYYSRGD